MHSRWRRTLPAYGVNELLATPMLPKNDPDAFARTIRSPSQTAAEISAAAADAASHV
jgi:hypothetical protein